MNAFCPFHQSKTRASLSEFNVWQESLPLAVLGPGYFFVPMFHFSGDWLTFV
jgi:hypothetical protein